MADLVAVCIIYTHIRFMRGKCSDWHIYATHTLPGLEVQGLSRDHLPYKAAFQPWASWFALISISVIMVFKGFDTFIHGKNEKFKAGDFVS